MNNVRLENRTLAGVLAIVLGISSLGVFGVHKFVLGQNKQGKKYLLMSLASLLLGFVTCGFGWLFLGAISLFSLVEGIVLLLKSDAQFAQEVAMGKEWL